MIIGLDRREEKVEKRLFYYPDVKGDPEESLPVEISPYLFDAGGLSDSCLVVREENRPINGMPKLVIGSKPIDGGHYIFTADERADFLKEEPGAEHLLRPFIGAREFLQGGERWILALHDTSPSVLAKLPKVRERVAAVRDYRKTSHSKPTQKLAETPKFYHINVLPVAPFLLIPRVSSERREYVPVGWLEPPTIPSDSAHLLKNATLSDFALLTSAMHKAWLRYIGGRLKSDYRYSIGLVYNTFPVPFKGSKLSKLEPFAKRVLDARAEYSEATLAELYDPDLMPVNLKRAHRELDRAVDRLYKRGGFSSERERIEHLFSLYEKMLEPLRMSTKKKPKRRRRVAARRR